jgi:hypothetical protein
MSELLARISEQPIHADTVDAAVAGPKSGAVVVFTGTVRNHDGGQAVSALEYQAHPDAERFLQTCCQEVAASTGLPVAAIHRVGHLEIGSRTGRRRRRPASSGGVRRVRRTGGAHQARGTDLEAATLRERRLRMGRVVGRTLREGRVAITRCLKSGIQRRRTQIFLLSAQCTRSSYGEEACRPAAPPPLCLIVRPVNSRVGIRARTRARKALNTLV